MTRQLVEWMVWSDFYRTRRLSLVHVVRADDHHFTRCGVPKELAPQIEAVIKARQALFDGG